MSVKFKLKRFFWTWSEPWRKGLKEKNHSKLDLSGPYSWKK